MTENERDAGLWSERPDHDDPGGYDRGRALGRLLARLGGAEGVVAVSEPVEIKATLTMPIGGKRKGVTMSVEFTRIVSSEAEAVEAGNQDAGLITAYALGYATHAEGV